MFNGDFQIIAKEVVLHDIDVSSALIYYAVSNSVGNIVVGASSRSLLMRFLLSLSLHILMCICIMNTNTYLCTHALMPMVVRIFAANMYLLAIVYTQEIQKYGCAI